MSSSTDWIHSSTLKMQKSPNLVPLGVWLKSLLIIENDTHLSHVGKTSLESPLGHEIETNVHVARRTRLGVKNCSCKKIRHPCLTLLPGKGVVVALLQKGKGHAHTHLGIVGRAGTSFARLPEETFTFWAKHVCPSTGFPITSPQTITPHQRISHLTWTPKVVKRGNIGRSLSCPPARGAGPGPGRSNASHALSLD